MIKITYDIFLGIIIPHDFLYFCTRDYNTQSILENYLGNFALMYALNPQIPEIHRIISGTKPHYEEDLSKVETYATCGFPISEIRLPQIIQIALSQNISSDKIISKEINKIQFTYNTSGESITFGMTKAELNLPNLGTYQKFPIQTLFATFIFGKKGPSIIRLGKKLIPCRMLYFQLNNFHESNIQESPNHPINIFESDISSGQLKSGEIKYLKPSPILINSIIRGNFINAQINEANYNIFLPKKERYPLIF